MKNVFVIILLCAALFSCGTRKHQPLLVSISYYEDSTTSYRHCVRLKVVNNSDDNLFIPCFWGFWRLTKDGVDFTHEFYNPPSDIDSDVIDDGIIDVFSWKSPEDERTHFNESERLLDWLVDKEMKKAKVDTSDLYFKSSYYEVGLSYINAVIPAKDSLIMYRDFNVLFKNGKPTADYKIWMHFVQNPKMLKKRLIHNYDDSLCVTFTPPKRVDNYKVYSGDITCADTVYLKP